VSVEFIAAASGTPGNNAAVTVSLPSGGQSGDYVVVVGCIRENGATLSCNGSVSEIKTGSGLSEVMLALWGRPWTDAPSSFTVTPSGGGANDVVLAHCAIFRGVDETTPYVNANHVNWSGTGQVVFSQILSSHLVNGSALGDAVLLLGATDNDVAGGNPSLSWSSVNSGHSTVTVRTETTTTGADATLATGLIRLDSAVFTASSSNTRMSFGGSGGLTSDDHISVYCLLKAASTGTTFAYTGSGGLRAGGTGAASFLTGYVGTGGARLGGAAESAWVPYHTTVGTGGARLGGAAEAQFSVTGLRHRDTGAGGTRCGIGSLTLTIPATAQVGDLLVLGLGVYDTGAAFPIADTPSGWNLIQTGNGSTDYHYAGAFWRACQAGDAGSTVTVSFSQDTSSASSKSGAVMAFWNVDFGAGPRASTQVTELVHGSLLDDFWGAQAPSGSDYVGSVIVGTSYNGSPLTLNSTGQSEGWVELKDQATACTYPADLHLLYSNSAGETTVEIGSLIAWAPLHQLIIGFLYRPPGSSPSHAFVGQGGAQLGGAGTSIFQAAGTGTQYVYAAAGGAQLGGVAGLDLIVTGLRLRALGALAESCSSGALAVTIPSTALVGDLLLLRAGVATLQDLAPVADTPSGWNVIAKGTINTSLGADLALFWRRCESGDPGSTVPLTWSDDPSADLGKLAQVDAFWNVDWLVNSGNPLGTGAPIVVLESGGIYGCGVAAYLAAPSSSLVADMGYGPPGGGTSATIPTAAGTAGGWVLIDADDPESCAEGPGLSLLASDTAEKTGQPVKLWLTGVVSEACSVSFAVLTRRSGQFYAAPAGGIQAGGSGLAAFVPVTVFSATGAGGAKPGGGAGCQFWPLGFVGTGASIQVYVGSVAVPVTDVQLRSTLDDVLLDLTLPGAWAPAVGAQVRLDVVWHGGNYTAAVASVTRVARRHPFTRVAAQGAALVGAGAYSPGPVTVAMTNRYRGAIDWRARPGQTVAGKTITGVTVTLSASSASFMELMYG
jgi:hypothetical protein